MACQRLQQAIELTLSWFVQKVGYDGFHALCAKKLFLLVGGLGHPVGE